MEKTKAGCQQVHQNPGQSKGSLLKQTRNLPLICAESKLEGTHIERLLSAIKKNKARLERGAWDYVTLLYDPNPVDLSAACSVVMYSYDTLGIQKGSKDRLGEIRRMAEQIYKINQTGWLAMDLKVSEL